MWGDVLKSISEAKRKSGDLTKTPASISGPEHYGLSNSIVLKLFSKMDGIEELHDFHPYNGESAASSAALSGDERDDFVVDFKKLFARAREQK